MTTMKISRFAPSLPAVCAAIAAMIGSAVPRAMSQQVGGSVSPESSSALRVDVSASVPVDEFLRGEDVPVDVTLRNSGRVAFVVDDYGEYLRNRIFVYVRNADSGALLLPRDGAPRSLVDSLELLPGQTKTVRVYPAAAYDISKHGRYHVTVAAASGERTSCSTAVSFTVVEGVELASAARSFGGDGSRVRVFTLLYWPRKQGEALFLRVTDDPRRGGGVVGFVSLGGVVRVADPTMTFGGDGTVTIVHQIGRDRFVRTKLDVSSDKPVVLDRDANLLSADAVSERISTRLVEERIDERSAERSEENQGFFSRRRARTRKALPASTGESFDRKSASGE